MAKVSFTVNDKLFKKQMRKIERYVNYTMPREALKIYKSETPKASINGGNARRNTKRRGMTIVGNYPYAGVLDDGLFPNPPQKGTGKTTGGYSTQAKKGMATPTIKKLNVLFNRFVRRVAGR